MQTTDILIRLGIALVCGALIGYERERASQPAGLRTHMILILGSCLAMILSISMAEAYGSDPERIAAQIIPGIGFLGAGAIMRFGLNIKGLTTASTVWTTAIIGMAIGYGLFAVGAVATLAVLVVLGILDTFEHKFIRSNRVAEIVIEMNDSTKTANQVQKIINDAIVRRLSYSLRRSVHNKHLRMEVVAQVSPTLSIDEMVDVLSKIEGVRAVKVE